MAAKQFASAITLLGNELQNFRFQNLTAAPATPFGPGHTYYDSVLNATYTFNGTTWVSHDASKLVGTIPISALVIDPRARSTHTGTQVSATISDLAGVVQAYRLDQFAAPTASVNFGGQRITNLLAPNASGQAAEYSWVIGQIQSAAAGIASKPPVRAVATTNITTTNTQTIDGVALAVGDRVLLVGQTDATQNGVYNVATTAWTRTTVEGPAPGEIEPGAMWLATEGSIGTGTQWRVSTTGAITIGTTSLNIVQFGAASVYTAGLGLTLNGGQFAVKASTGILVTAAGVSVDMSVLVGKVSATITGDGTTTVFQINHTLNTQDITAQVRMGTTPFSFIEVDIAPNTTTQITVTFSPPPANGATYRLTAHG